MQAIKRTAALCVVALALIGAAGEQPKIKELVDPESTKEDKKELEADKPPAPGPPPGPIDDFNRGVPRTSVEGFMEAAEAEDWERAAEYLHLHGLPRHLASRGAPQLARELVIVLGRALWIDPETLSSDPAGRKEEGLPASQEFLGRVETPEAKVDVLLRRVPRGDGVSIWKFSNTTVAEIPLLSAHYSFGVLGEYLAQIVPVRRVLGIPLWEWTGLLLLLIAAGLAAWLGGAVLGAVLRLTRLPGIASWEARFRGPVRLLILVLVGRSAVGLLGPTVALRAVLEARTLLIFVAAWFAVRIGDVLIERGAARLRRRGQPAAELLGKPARNFTRVVIVVLALAFWLDLLGVRITTLLAGLGIGGLAVALAAQRPIEDLIGAFTIYATQPVRLGDFCRFGGHMGTVEEIGLRSTRVRTLDDSLVSVPNGEFSKTQVDNLGQRRKIWYHPRIRLRYETSPDQLRCILVEIRRILCAHPKVLSDPARVRFVGFGEWSLDLDVFAYVDTTDYGEYLEITEDLSLRIMDAVGEAGSAFAFPSETAYVETGRGLDEDRAEGAEARVREWRERHELHLPAFPAAVVEELRGSIAYPPEGSSATDDADKT